MFEQISRFKTICDFLNLFSLKLIKFAFRFLKRYETGLSGRTNG